MSYPFPGMNPWLENPTLWRNVHQSPSFPLPQLPGDQEPLVDLGARLHEVYDRARYKLVIDYSQPPTPALNEDDGAWAAECLAAIH